MSGDYGIVDTRKGSEIYSFDGVSKAEPGSELLNDFRKYLENELEESFGDKEIVFNRFFNNRGVGYSEIDLVVPHVFQRDRIVVLPFASFKILEDSSMSISAEGASTKDEYSVVVFDWLRHYGENRIFLEYSGGFLDPIIRRRKTKEYNVYRILSNGSRLLEGVFEDRFKAENFADEWAVEKSSSVVISSVEEQVRDLRSPDELNKLKIRFATTEKNYPIRVGFLVVGEGIGYLY